MENYIHNVILIVSNSKNKYSLGLDAEFSVVKGRMIFDYIIDSCRKSKLVDTIVISSIPENKDFFENRYNIETVACGQKQAEKIISEKYNCKKIIIVSSFYPLVTSNQLDEYFNLLDNYSQISTLGNDNIEAYPIAKSLKDDSMPQYICKDYQYCTCFESKETIEFFYEKYEEFIVKPQEEKTLNIVNYYLSADGTKGISEWISNVKNKINEYVEKYELTSYFINSQTEGNIVYEATSKKYGDIVIKFTPSKKKFHKEWVYYYYSKPGIMAKMIDYDTENNILVLEMIKPGFQVKFSKDNKVLRDFFDFVDNNMIPVDRIGDDNLVPSVIGEFNDYLKWASKSDFEYDFRKSMEKKAYKVWDAYFKNQNMYYLHRDLHKRNILSCDNGKVVAIDPMGAIGPHAFEYVIQFIIELREYPEELNSNLYYEMLDYFSKYIDKEELEAALFFFWVFKMNDYCFQKNDGYKLANWCKKCIEKIYFDGIEDPISDDIMPKGLNKV